MHRGSACVDVFRVPGVRACRSAPAVLAVTRGQTPLGSCAQYATRQLPPFRPGRNGHARDVETHSLEGVWGRRTGAHARGRRRRGPAAEAGGEMPLAARVLGERCVSRQRPPCRAVPTRS
eukprot:353532-Chlamydomonas_euryale.AAC.2